MAHALYHQESIASGETIAYRECGDGDRTVIFLHGNLTTCQCWEKFIEEMPPGFKCIAPDLRGAGMSSYMRPVEYIRQFSQDMYYLCKELKLERFDLVGLSMGGAVAMQLAADYPEMVERLVLVDSVPSQGFPDQLVDMDLQPIPGKYLDRWDLVMIDPVKVLPITAALRTFNGIALSLIFNEQVFNVKQPEMFYYMEFIQQIFTVRNFPDCAWAINQFNISHDFNGVSQGTKEVTRLTMPVLVMIGDQDLVFTRESAEKTVQDIGDKAIFRVIPDSGHISPIDNPEAVMRELLDFLG